jgi:hypothetical protein
MAEQSNEASGLFSIFFVSIYTLFLVVYTLFRLCGGDEAETTQPVAQVSRSLTQGCTSTRACPGTGVGARVYG